MEDLKSSQEINGLNDYFYSWSDFLVLPWTFEETLFNLITKKVDKSKVSSIEILKSSKQLEVLKSYKKSLEFLDFIRSRSGFQLRKIVENYSTPTSKKILIFINNWNQILNKLVSGQSITEKDLFEFTLDEEYFNNPNIVYEKILTEDLLIKKWIRLDQNTDFQSELMKLINLSRIKKWISNQEVWKWIPLVKETFQDKSSDMLDLFIDELWFIPEELYTKVSFNSNTFDNISNFHKKLREKEKIASTSKDESKLQKIKYARSLFLKYIFLEKSWKWWSVIKSICSQEKSENNNQVTLDTNWVWIKIFKWKKSISSHLPYSLCDDVLIETWLKDLWINKEEYIEIKKQKLKDNGSDISYKFLELNQVDNCIENLSLVSSANKSVDEKLKLICDEIIFNREKIVNALVEKDFFIPQIVFDFLLKSEKLNLTESDRLHRLFLFWECITTKLSNEVLFDNREMFLNYDLAYKSRNAYQIRMKYLHNSPKYYNVFKILETIFSQKLPANSIKDDFLIFRWKYSSNKLEQSFIEVIHDDVPSRILLSDEKHLPSHLVDKVNKLPTFNSEMYENIELLMRTFSLAKINLKSLKAELNNLQFDKKETVNNDVFEIIHHYWIDIILFILNYVPWKYNNINKSFTQLLTSSSKNRDLIFSKVDEFISSIDDIFLDVDENIWLYLKNKENKDLLSSVSERELVFDNNYLEKIKQAWLQDYAYCEDFFTWDTSIKVVSINWNKESSSISYMDESLAVNKLWLSDKKPLIVVSGWCKNISIDGVSLLDILSEQIVKVWWKQWVNISIPCTQSGIWNSLWLAYQKYSDLTFWLSDTKTMKMFAVAPWKIMYDPDNNMIWNDEWLYAPSPVDQIYYDYRSDWDLNDKSIVNAWYFQFIDSAEAIYNRLDKNKSRVHIIMNGWLFSISESMSAMKNWAKTAFVKWTWRLADAMASVYKNIWDIINLTVMEDDLKTFWDYFDYFLWFQDIVSKDMILDDYNEWLKKDWWNDIELSDDIKSKKINSFDDFFENYCDLSEGSWLTPKHIYYRLELRNYIMLSIRLGKTSQIVDISDLEKFLEVSVVGKLSNL